MSAGLETPEASRSPWQLLYQGAHRLRGAWHRRRARSLPPPVLSVGNLHWGGTGKTPLVAAVAGHLRDLGRRVCILSRGYGGEGAGVRVVSRGEGPLLGPLVAGDEPVLLAGRLPGVAVVVSPNRWRGGVQALERLDPPPDLFLLDDGFSHLALKRDLDLLVFPLADPFGGGRLPPSGRLREPLQAAGRADAVLLTGRGVEEGDGARLARALRSFGFRGQGFACPSRPGSPARLHGGEVSPGTRVFLVSAIARPERFHDSAEALGLEIAAHRIFADHHRYPDGSLEKLRSAFRESRAEVIVTTSKDLVKLQGRLSLPLAELPVTAEPEHAFWAWLGDRLSSFEDHSDAESP